VIAAAIYNTNLQTLLPLAVEIMLLPSQKFCQEAWIVDGTAGCQGIGSQHQDSLYPSISTWDSPVARVDQTICKETVQQLKP